jgi:hypothetical protein
MAFYILPQPSAASARLAPVEARYAPMFCFSLLTAACVLASLAFGCATPFAAFAVLAAAMLPLQPALLVVGAAWLVNQAIGFGVRGYPADTHTVLWGLAIGAAALLATVISVSVLQALSRTGRPKALGFALIGAYAAYELTLFAATPFLGWWWRLHRRDCRSSRPSKRLVANGSDRGLRNVSAAQLSSMASNGTLNMRSVRSGRHGVTTKPCAAQARLDKRTLCAGACRPACQQRRERYAPRETRLIAAVGPNLC